MVSNPQFRRNQTFFHKKYVLEYAQPQGYAYAICSKESDDPIGYIKVSTDHRHELGYGLRKDFWNKGIMTEADSAVIEQVKKRWNSLCDRHS